MKLVISLKTQFLNIIAITASFFSIHVRGHVESREESFPDGTKISVDKGIRSLTNLS